MAEPPPALRRIGPAAAIVSLLAVVIVGAIVAGTFGLLAPAPGASPTTAAAATPSPVPSPSATPATVTTPEPSTPGPPQVEPPIDTGTPEPCGTFDPRCNRLPVDGAGAVFTPDLPCGELGTCRLTMGIAYPRSSGPWPVVVVVPGGPRAPGSDRYLGDFAGSVASQGAVVFIADYRAAPQWGGGWPTSYQDVACAIRFARANADQWGGDGSRVTLVAHSFGAFVASVVALSPDPFEPDAAACLASGGSTKPDAFVGIAGVYSQQDVSPNTLESFFGGTQDQQTSLWAAGDPYALVAARSNPQLPIRLIQGTLDTNVPPSSAQRFEEALQAAGYDSTLTLIERTDHSGILQDHHTIGVVMETALGGPR